MVRQKFKRFEYFLRLVDFYARVIAERLVGLDSLDDNGKAGSLYDIGDYCFRLLVSRYSRGDAVSDMHNSVFQMTELLTLKCKTLASIQLGKDVRQMYERLDLGALYESLSLLAFMVLHHGYIPAELGDP